MIVRATVYMSLHLPLPLVTTSAGRAAVVSVEAYVRVSLGKAGGGRVTTCLCLSVPGVVGLGSTGEDVLMRIGSWR